MKYIYIYIYIPPYSCCEFFLKLPCRHSVFAPVPAPVASLLLTRKSPTTHTKQSQRFSLHITNNSHKTKSKILTSHTTRMSREEKVACVTGASGYIAAWLVKLLLQRGYIVKATVRDTSQCSLSFSNLYQPLTMY